MVQFPSINFFLGFLQFLLGFSKVSVFLCHSVHYSMQDRGTISAQNEERKRVLLSDGSW